MIDQKLRTLLAVFGVSIGIAAVIAFMAVGEGARQDISKKLEAYGTNVLLISAGKTEINAGRKNQTTTVTSLKLSDGEKVLDEVRGVRQIAPHQSRDFQIKSGNMITNASVDGSTPSYFELKNFRLATGRIFNEDEDKVKARVAVIGSQINDHLFNNEDAIGQRIYIGKIPFEVIGVLKAKGVTGVGALEDDRIIIPLQTALRRLFNQNHLQDILVQFDNAELLTQADSEIRQVIRTSHRLERLGKKDDFKIFNQLKAIQAEQQATDTFNSLTISVATLSLIVGGTGILAVMLLSVKERLPEIGLRMALGAGRGDIVFQFLSESALLSISGGVLGIGIGYLSTYLVERLTDWNAIIPSDILGFSILFSVVLGLGFGIYPAYQASNQDPVICLTKNN